MIVVDAGVPIALFDVRDAHHEAAVALFTEHLDASFGISPVTEAEVLVRAAREGLEERMLTDLRGLGIELVPLPVDAGIQLARLRAGSGAKMPDCCVLLAAQQTGAHVATFDASLASAASRTGLSVLPA